MKTFPEIPRNQRVVVRFGNGMHQILGHIDQLGGRTPPTTTLATFAGGRTAPIDLVASKPRYLLYVESTPPKGLGTFDRRQK
jgi:hypothetical protein